MSHSNRHLARYGDLTWDDVCPDHGPGCDGPLNCTCEDPGPTDTGDDDLEAVEAPADTPAALECLTLTDGKHEYEEATGYPEYSGRCAVYAVCTICGYEAGQTGWDSVL